MVSLHVITVKPTDGITLHDITKREWMRGASFEVVDSTYMPFQSSWSDRRRNYKFHITRSDVLDAEETQNVKFEVVFDVETVEEHFTNLAEENSFVDDHLNLLLRGM